MSFESILLLLVLFLLVPGASLLWGAKMKRKSDLTEIKFRKEAFNEKSKEITKEVNALDDDELLAVARSLYPDKSRKLPEDK